MRAGPAPDGCPRAQRLLADGSIKRCAALYRRGSGNGEGCRQTGQPVGSRATSWPTLRQLHAEAAVRSVARSPASQPVHDSPSGDGCRLRPSNTPCRDRGPEGNECAETEWLYRERNVTSGHRAAPGRRPPDCTCLGSRKCQRSLGTPAPNCRTTTSGGRGSDHSGIASVGVIRDHNANGHLYPSRLATLQRRRKSGRLRQSVGGSN